VEEGDVRERVKSSGFGVAKLIARLPVSAPQPMLEDSSLSYCTAMKIIGDLENVKK
jgi:hypothetical protein